MALSHFFRTPHIALKMEIQCNKSVTICISEVASKAKIKCLLKWFSSSYRLFYSLRATLWVPKISVMLLYRYLKLHFFQIISAYCAPLYVNHHFALGKEKREWNVLRLDYDKNPGSAPDGNAADVITTGSKTNYFFSFYCSKVWFQK